MRHLYKFILLASSISLSLSVFGINKCIEDSGKVSYQDRPCKADQSAETVSFKKNRDSKNTDNLEPVYVKIPGVGDGVLFSYKWWSFSIIQPKADLPPIIKMVSKQGEEPISFSISFLPTKTGEKISLEESANTVFDMATIYAAGSVEKEVKLRKLDTTIGTAVFASFNDEKYLNSPIPKGEFSSITVGQVAHSKLVVGFTILTNGTQSKALNEALNIIGSFKVVANK